MNFYELVLLIRSDITSANVDKIIDELEKLISKSGKVVKKEYWNIITLSYDIKGLKRAHAYLLGIQLPPSDVLEMKKKIAFNENILRIALLKVDSIWEGVSPILQSTSNNSSLKTVDVTMGSL